jgi:HK97 family phage prohead protease
MKHTMIDTAEFLARVADGNRPQAAVRLAVAGTPIMADDARVASFVFSDSSIARYGDIIDAHGWKLDAFAANLLFGHDAGSPANGIGRARNVRIEGNKLVGDIEFADASVNPNAEIVYQLLKGGYLNTVSVGFQPIEWEATKDKSRPGGIDFKKQELLEISVAPVPANANALVQAKAAGIDIDRLRGGGDGARRALITTKSLYHVGYLRFAALGARLPAGHGRMGGGLRGRRQ